MRIIVFILVIGLTGCRQSGEQNENVQAVQATQSAEPGHTTCYAYVNNKDSASLKLIVNGTSFTGDLQYHWFEKDNNEGTVEGVLRGDTLVGKYTFHSEGQSSVREVVFLRRADQLIEGFGPIAQFNEQMRFKDRKQIDFNAGLVFKKISCR